MKKSLDNKKILKWLATVFLIWRLGLEIAVWFGGKFLPQKGYLGPSVWANFDGIHYLWIAQNGYGLYQQAFFPLYPWLIRWLASFIHNYLFSGLVISHLAFFASLYLLYRLLLFDFSEKFARRVIILLLLFPTSFFFASFYSESLFFFLMIAAFYFARKGKWLVAGIFGALASATRLVGIFLLPALLVEWGEQKKIQNPKSKIQNDNLKFRILQVFSIFLTPLGLIFYMRYLAVHWGDPLLFAHVQEHFGAQRTSGKIILLYQVFWRYFKMILTTKPDPLYFVVWLELLTAIGFLALLIWGYFQKIRLSWLLFGILAYILPTLTGTFSSLPRYVLVIFPGFVGLGLLTKKYRWGKILYLIFAILLLISTAFFTRGYWLA